MRTEMAEWVATALFVAAGRQVGEAELLLWGNTLATVDEEGAEEAVNAIIASVDLGLRPPTPALFMEHRRGVLGQRSPAPHTCPCLGIGLVEDGGQEDAWRPCGRCNPAGYERWTKGRFMSRFAGQPSERGTGHVRDLRDSLAGSES